MPSFLGSIFLILATDLWKLRIGVCHSSKEPFSGYRFSLNIHPTPLQGLKFPVLLLWLHTWTFIFFALGTIITMSFSPQSLCMHCSLCSSFLFCFPSCSCPISFCFNRSPKGPTMNPFLIPRGGQILFTCSPNSTAL